MTPEQREWCIGEAVWAGEGSCRREDMETMPDRDIAADTLHAWSDWVKSNTDF
jgi:hypothetical protein